MLLVLEYTKSHEWVGNTDYISIIVSVADAVSSGVHKEPRMGRKYILSIIVFAADAVSSGVHKELRMGRQYRLYFYHCLCGRCCQFWSTQQAKNGYAIQTIFLSLSLWQMLLVTSGGSTWLEWSVLSCITVVVQLTRSAVSVDSWINITSS